MKAPAFQFYVRDWLNSRAVQKMNGDEVKAYIYLLAESWLEEPRASLPDDDNDLALMAKLPIEKWMRVKAKVMANFIPINGRMVNEKLAGISEQQLKFKKWGGMGGNPNLLNSSSKEVNPTLNPTLKDKVNLATATATALNKKETSLKRSFTDSWCLEFQKTFGVPYKFEGAKDGMATDSLLKTGIQPDKLIIIAKKAWVHSHSKFWSKNSLTISGLSSKFNEIRGEIGELKPISKEENSKRLTEKEALENL